MRRAAALRVLYLFSLLPPALASIVCYDHTSAMHPEVRSPANCWLGSFGQIRRRSSTVSGPDKFEDPVRREHVIGDGGSLQQSPTLRKRDVTYSMSRAPLSEENYSHGHHRSHQHHGDDQWSDNITNLPFFDWAPYSPLSEILSQPALPPPTWNSSQQIYFNLDCGPPSSPEFCCGMSKTLDIAGWYVSQIIEFYTPISVNVSATDFCAEYGACNSTASVDIILGGAVPARTFPLIDDDGVVRYYPQAVVRQMYFPPGHAPQSAPYDIVMEFNSKANFWFQSSNTSTIQPDQYDFLTIAIHEIMHGLGFTTGWSDIFQYLDPTILTPQIALSYPQSHNGIQFEGFVETAYDRLMSFTNYPGYYPSNLTVQMTTSFGNLNGLFPNETALAMAFISSPAVGLAESMYSNATERGAIKQALPVINASNATLESNISIGPLITLETSFNPFISGSSLIHVDGAMYVSTPDFLMRYSTPMGKTLEDLVKDYGNTGDSNYGPFGPGLRYILAGIGYSIRGGIPLGGSIPNPPSETSSLGGQSSSLPGSAAAGTGVQTAPPISYWTSVYWTILGSWLILCITGF